jgi:hypothetical protein
VRQRALERESRLAGPDDHAAQALDVLGKPAARIEQGALGDLLPVATALAQQDGGRRLETVSIYMKDTESFYETRLIFTHYMATYG